MSLELVPKVLQSSFAKLVISLKEIAYTAFDLPGALYFFHIIVILCGGCVKGMLMSLATKGLTDEPFWGRSA